LYFFILILVVKKLIDAIIIYSFIIQFLKSAAKLHFLFDLTKLLNKN